jgi:hypothetical protein
MPCGSRWEGRANTELRRSRRDPTGDFDIGQPDGGRGACYDEPCVREDFQDLAECFHEDRAALSLPVDSDKEDGTVRVAGVVGERDGGRQVRRGAHDSDAGRIAAVILDERIPNKSAHDQARPRTTVNAGFEFDPTAGKERLPGGAGIAQIREVGVIGVKEVGHAVDAGVVERLGLDGEEAGAGEAGVLLRDQTADGME